MIILFRRIHFLLLFCFLFANAVPQNSRADDLQIDWGKARLDSALVAAGYDIKTLPVKIVIERSGATLAQNSRRPEGYHVSIQKGEITVHGFDAAGAMYGCLTLAEKISHEGRVPQHWDFSDAPAMGQRGTCILLMKLGTYNYPITPKEFPFFYDKDLWLEYLDFLAKNRFNYVAFWNGHPFDYFVKLEKYPEAQAGMPPGLVQKNHDMLLWLCREGARRNIRFMFEFYNIHTSVYFQKAHHLPNEISEPTPLLKDYTMYCIEKFVNEFPQVGLYITPGEAIKLEYTDSWLNDVIFPAVKRTGRTPPVFVRAWGIDLQHARKVAGNYPDLYFERKYNVEMIADTLVDPENAEWAKLNGNHVVNIHCLGNLEPFRWNPPSYIQKCLQSARRAGANGLHLYPRKAWRWPYGCDKGEKELQWKRDALWFEMWGRYAWNPDRDSDAERRFWLNRLTCTFGTREAATHFLDSFAAGADVLPALQRLFWLGYDNHTVVAAGGKVIQLQSAEGIPFLPLSVMRIPAYLAALQNGKPLSSKSPMDFLAEKVADAKNALEEAHRGARAASKNEETAKRYETDARAIWLVAKFYEHKMQAVTAKALFENQMGGDAKRREFLADLQASLQDFRALTELADTTYESLSDVPARHPERLKICPYHWRDVLPIYEKEFEIYQKTMAQQTDSSFYEPSLSGLAGIFYGDPDLKNADKTLPSNSLHWNWSADTEDTGRNWSAQWFGFLRAPASKVTFYVYSDRGAILEMNGKKIIEWTGSEGEHYGTIQLQKNKMIPIRIIYNHNGGNKGHVEILWSWNGQKKTSILPDYLFHSHAQQRQMEEVTFLLKDEKY